MQFNSFWKVIHVEFYLSCLFFVSFIYHCYLWNSLFWIPKILNDWKTKIATKTKFLASVARQHTASFPLSRDQNVITDVLSKDNYFENFKQNLNSDSDIKLLAVSLSSRESKFASKQLPFFNFYLMDFDDSSIPSIPFLFQDEMTKCFQWKTYFAL